MTDPNTVAGSVLKSKAADTIARAEVIPGARITKERMKMTDDKILVVTYTEITVRVPGSYHLDPEEFREWYAKEYPWRGDPLTDYDWDAEEVLEFLNHSPDLQSEVWSELPDLDTDKHDIMETKLVEVEFA